MAQVDRLMAVGFPAGQAVQIGNVPTGTLTGAGSAQSTATTIPDGSIAYLTGTGGFILPYSSDNPAIALYNIGTQALSIYAASQETINNISTTQAFILTQGRSVQFLPMSAGWTGNEHFAGVRQVSIVPTSGTAGNAVVISDNGVGFLAPTLTTQTTIVAMLPAVYGQPILYYNNTSTGTVGVYPATNEKINNFGDTAAFSVTTGKSAAFFPIQAGWIAILSA